MQKRLLVIFLLGFSSGLPLSLLSSTLQAWFAVSGVSLLATGMLSLVGLPYIYRILWAPLLDRYALFAIGRRRSWILITQLLLGMGFNALAWFNPQHSLHTMMGIAFLLAIFSATQDVAIDAQRTEYLPIQEHGMGAALGVLGYRMGLLLAGGLALVLADNYGWAFTYRLMGACMLFGVFATLWSEEPAVQASSTSNLVEIFVEPCKELFARPYFFTLLGFILFYKLGEAFTATTSGIVMPFLIHGLGFSLSTIGYINKIFAVGALIAGGLLAGLLLLRWTLFRALLVFGLLQAGANFLFIVLAYVGQNVMLLALAVGLDNFAAGMGSTALVALLMRLVNQRFTGTQFALLVAMGTIPRVFSGPIAAVVQMQVGWIGLYILAFLLALLFVPFLFKLRFEIDAKDALRMMK